jgi:hypothetical protein
MMVLTIRIEHPFDVAIQCPHDADARKHCRAAAGLRDQDQPLPSPLAIRRPRAQLGNVVAGVLEDDEWATVRQRDRIVKGTLPNRNGPALQPIGCINLYHPKRYKLSFVESPTRTDIAWV